MTKKIVYLFFAIIFLLIVAIYSSIKYSKSRQPTNLSSVEIKEYRGEKLGSIDKFRENSIKGVQYIEKDKYELEIFGLVNNPIKLRYDDILALPMYQKVVTLNCVEGWSVKALWSGFLIKDILADYNVPMYWTTALGGYGIMKPYEKPITKTESIYRISRPQGRKDFQVVQRFSGTS